MNCTPAKCKPPRWLEIVDAKLQEKTKALTRTAKREEYHRERKVNKESNTALSQPTEREGES